MHILFITENYPPEVNATASRVSERAAYWVRWGHRVTVLTSAPNFPQGRVYPGYRNRWYSVEEMEGVRVVRVKTYISQNKGVRRRLLDFISLMVSSYLGSFFQDRPDVVVATSPQFFVTIAGWMIGVTRRCPFVFEIGDLWPASVVAVGAMQQSRMMRLVEKLELFLYHRSSAIVALTKAFKNNLI